MCVQAVRRGRQELARHERGRLIPLFRGATSKIILAYLPPRTLKSLFTRNSAAIVEAGLGDTWDAFRHRLAALRRDGVAVARGELELGRACIAAPIFEGHSILGSLSFVLPTELTDDTLLGRLAPLTVAGAREIERAMTDQAAAATASPARVRVAR
jgi:DNA-binding IclR family transcriptional regulator